MSLQSGRLPDADIERARSVGLVDFIGQHVELKKSGDEHKGLCPFHGEKSPSFTVTPDEGYFCFGCGACGHDAISFVEKLYGIDFRSAVQRINGDLSVGYVAPVQRPSLKQDDAIEWQPIVPVPADCSRKPMATFHFEVEGVRIKVAATSRFDYLNADGALIGCVFRFDIPGGGKQVLPQSYCLNTKTGEMQWRWLSFGKPRPLFGLDKLAAHPNAQVLVVEGEKTADAAQALYEAAGISRDKLVTVSWPGGGKAVKYVEWSPLAGRAVALWPDADQPGRDCMLDIAGRLDSLAKIVKIISPPKGVESGWDLADTAPDGFNLLVHTKDSALPIATYREKYGLGAGVVDLGTVRKHRGGESAAQTHMPPAEFEEVAESEALKWPGAEMQVQHDNSPAKNNAGTVAVDALGGSDQLGIIPLGVQADMYAFWRVDTGTLELIRSREVASEPSILRLASRQVWEMWCTESSGKYDRGVIANALIQTSKHIGQMDLGRVPEAVASAAQVEQEYARAMLCTRPSSGTVAQVLCAHPAWKEAGIWFDEFANEIKLTNEPPCGGGPGSWSDHHDVLLCGWASAQWGVTLTTTCAAEAVTALAMQNKRHPVREYLSALKWDGTTRLDGWLNELAGCPLNQYTKSVGAKTLIGAVARVMRPGCKVDTVLILEGEQGARKSSLVAALMPNEAWFSEDLGADIGSKDAMAGLAGKWVVELAELANMHKSESNAIKSFISRKVDHYRPSYGRRAMDFPRQTVLIGTTNIEGDGRYLRDPTGARRFWPVTCGEIDIPKAREIRDQLWAEALVRFSGGEQWWLDADGEKAARSAQEDRQEDNQWSGRVVRFLSYLSPAENGGEWGGRRFSAPPDFTTGEVFEAFFRRPMMDRETTPESRKIASALREAGWKQVNRGRGSTGIKCRFWVLDDVRQALQQEVGGELPI